MSLKPFFLTGCLLLSGSFVGRLPVGRQGLTPFSSFCFAEPPKDPKALAIYEHNKKWLSTYPGAFIVTNIRGKDLQYAERRQAALDLIRERRDRIAIPELTQALEENSFLSDQICTFFAEIKAKETIPILQQVANDKKRPKVVRQRAQEAITAIQKP